MGKYIKKSKIAGDVSVKGISHPTTSGFRTRAAKSLALHRLRSQSSSPSEESDSFCYLQLRSRRLVKLPFIADTRKQQKQQLIQRVDECQTRNPKAKSFPTETTVLVTETKEDYDNTKWKSGTDCKFGVKGFDFDRETKDSEAIQNVPLSHEIEDFFAYAEQQQQRFFIEKYNFDIVSENPLPGRYEWIKVMS